MPRDKRILVEGGIYHVFNRGICRKDIQFCQEHSEYFMWVLELAARKYSVNIFAYCLMRNHFHLMLQTPKANLDRFMQYFGSKLARGINQMLGGDGALFKERYRAIWVKDETYLLQLFKYIHLNPVKSNIVNSPSYYRFSSYRAYIGLAENPQYLDAAFMLSLFRSREALINFHEGEISPVLEKFYSRKRLPSILSQDTVQGRY